MIFDNRSIFLGFRYRLSTYADDVWDTYWYAKDVQGDITEIYSSAGVKLIHYGYDAWGNTTVTYSNGGASTTAVKNNLTYRGYYYDRNLSLYYLQSRYYDAKICRFISPDSLMSGTNGSLHGFNLYVYCFNNPISYTDSEGNWPELLENAYEWAKDKKDKAKEVWEDVTEWVVEKISNIDGTRSAGFSGSVTINHVVINAQLGGAIDEQGEKDLQLSIFVGLSSSSYGWFVGGYYSETNAPRVSNLLGSFLQTGVSLGVPIEGIPCAIGMDSLSMKNSVSGEIYHGTSVVAGLGTSGVEIHNGYGSTLPISDVIKIFTD